MSLEYTSIKTGLLSNIMLLSFALLLDLETKTSTYKRQIPFLSPGHLLDFHKVSKDFKSVERENRHNSIDIFFYYSQP